MAVNVDARVAINVIVDRAYGREYREQTSGAYVSDQNSHARNEVIRFVQERATVRRAHRIVTKLPTLLARRNYVVVLITCISKVNRVILRLPRYATIFLSVTFVAKACPSARVGRQLMTLAFTKASIVARFNVPCRVFGQDGLGRGVAHRFLAIRRGIVRRNGNGQIEVHMTFTGGNNVTTVRVVSECVEGDNRQMIGRAFVAIYRFRIVAHYYVNNNRARFRPLLRLNVRINARTMAIGI